ncbi:hypothetical protein AY599_07615 [Leptolyngbya valderiana BDU 20041]|nr:hypothetical protein AY599_07615 [Leptolyngbya valderiana BDU 20041]
MDRRTLEQHLMTDPDLTNPEVVDAARADEDCAAVLRESERFERDLHSAMTLPSRPGLAQDIIERRKADHHRPELPWMLATAAALTLAIGVVALQMIPGEHDHAHRSSDVWTQLAEHWTYDGQQALASSQTANSDPEDIEALLSGLGIDAERDLIDRVRLGKICPTPSGEGAHLVLTTDDGPITLILMPRTEAPPLPSSQTLSDGKEAWLIGLENGSMAVIADPDQGAFDLARRLGQQVRIGDQLSL